MLVDGDVDAVFHAVEPQALPQVHPKVARLFTDSRRIEQQYYVKTGIFPIMHAVALRKRLIEAHPWITKAGFRFAETLNRPLETSLRLPGDAS